MSLIIEVQLNFYIGFLNIYTTLKKYFFLIKNIINIEKVSFIYLICSLFNAFEVEF